MNRVMRLDWVSIAAFLNFLKNHYPFLFCVGIAIVHPQWKFLVYLFLVLILCQLLINLNQNFKALQQFLMMYDDLFAKLSFLKDKEHLLKRYRLSDYFQQDQVRLFFEQTFVNPYLNMFHENIDEAIYIIDSRYVGKDILSNLVCYSRPMFTSFVYIKQPPAYDMKPMEKLKIAHEIGHFCLSPIYLPSKRKGGILLFLLFAFLIYRFVDLHAVPVFFILIYVVTLLFKLSDWILAWLPDSLRDEVYADLFSLHLLTDNERTSILARFSTPKYKTSLFFNNKKMIKIHIQRRAAIFIRNLELACNGQAHLMYQETMRDMEPPLFFTFIVNILWCVFYLLPGLFVKEQIIFSIEGMIFLNLAILGVLVFLYVLNRYSDSWISGRSKIIEFS